MYAWVWQHLPGDVRSKAVCAVVLAVGAMALLWFVVFPWITPRLPLDRVMPHG